MAVLLRSRMLDACRRKTASRAVGRNVLHRNANFGLLLLVWLVSLSSLKTQTVTFDSLIQSSSRVRPRAVALCTTSPQRSCVSLWLRTDRRTVARKAVVAVAAVASPAARRRRRHLTATELPTKGAATAATSGRRRAAGSAVLPGDRSPVVKAKRDNKSIGAQAATGSLTTTGSKQVRSKAKVSAIRIKQPSKHNKTPANLAASIETAATRSASAATSVRCASVQSADAAPGTEQGLPSDVPRIALLIDGDQVSKNAFALILDSLRQCGQIVDRRAYLSEHLARVLDEDLTRHQIRPVIVRRHVGGTKSPVDMAIAMDVLELCERSQGDKLAGVAIASNDLDFCEVLERARSRGMKVWQCMRRLSYSDQFSTLAQRAAADLTLE
ncbi:unnamed protein product [Polarella glacialis]|uniref:NYN domain-containing protein n=1 Tax=Polarella glacialis TaxID=89957 RepID=A0A813IPR2_POLGL|nr:unnamed protein product [Polarella glacialis]